MKCYLGAPQVDKNEQPGLCTHCSQKYMDLTVVNNHLPSPSFRMSGMRVDDGRPFPSKQSCADLLEVRRTTDSWADPLLKITLHLWANEVLRSIWLLF